MDAANNPSELGEPISFSQSLSACGEDVWQEISKPGNLVDFHPFCESNPVEIWPGTGSRDRVCYYNGLVLVRDFTNWIDGKGYDLTATSENNLQFRVSWRITYQEDYYSTLTLTIRQLLDPGSERKTKQFARLLEKYLQQVGQGLEYYMRTGQRVTRNQFGAHRLFSPPVAETNVT
ncbi:MAG: hypothetical protein WBG94_10710 [Anaerolineales bacterium]